MKDTADVIAATWAAELPGATGLELELSKRIGRLATILGDAIGVELARLDLTKADYEVLAVLRAAGRPYRLRPTDLTTRLLLSSGGTSNVLRRLASAGLISREADDTDARSSWVTLTGQGVTTAEAAVRAASAAQRARLSGVPDEKLKDAADALRAVLIALGDVPR